MARAKKIYKITVNNWNEHNKDHKKAFKKTLIANSFCTDAKITALPLTHRWLFLGILLACGDHNSECIEMSESVLRAMLESSKSVSSALDRLKSFQLISFEIIFDAASVKGNEKKGSEMKRNEKKLNDRDTAEAGVGERAVQTFAAAPKNKFDFDEIYAEYPRKEGKADGMEVLKKTILTDQQLQELKLAVQHYAEECRLSNREKRYIRQWSSFIGPASKPYWRDWIEWKADKTKPGGHNTRTKQIYDNLDMLEREWAEKGEQ